MPHLMETTAGRINMTGILLEMLHYLISWSIQNIEFILKEFVKWIHIYMCVCILFLIFF